MNIGVKMRADAEFIDPALYRMGEGLGVNWAINQTKNTVLKAQTEDLMEEVKQEYEQGEDDETITRYTGLWYQAENWNKKRRVCAKIQYGLQGANRCFW